MKRRYSTPISRRAGPVRQWLAILALCIGTTAAHAQPESIEGLWQSIDDETGQPKARIELYLEKKRLYGRVVELLNRGLDEDPNPLCKRCPGAKKNQPIIGMIIVEGLRWIEDSWTKGTILDPAKGKRYDCKIWREGEQLKVRGYLGIFFRTQTWQPVAK